MDIIRRFDFKAVEDLCRTTVGLNRGKSIASGVLRAASKNPVGFQSLLNNIVQQSGSAVMEQDACGILGKIQMNLEPQGFFTSLFKSLLGPFFKTGDTNT